MLALLNRSSSVEADPVAEREPLGRELHAQLVRSLYSTPKSIAIASAVAVFITCVTSMLEADQAYAGFVGAYCVVGAGRLAAGILFGRMDVHALSRAQLRMWENCALAGAWAFSGTTGLLGAYSTIFHPGSDAEILTSCCAIGYIAGISSRNAGRPLITIGQISAICIPFFCALVWRMDLAHATLALFILSLFASTIVMSRSMHEHIVQRHEADAALHRSALTDALTGLKNRSAFIAFVERQLDTGRPLALIAIDLDRFKSVNDRLGHPAGDAVLREAARRIEGALDVQHLTARIGGDEFLVAIHGPEAVAPEAVADRLLAALGSEYFHGPTKIICGASVGVAIAPADGGSYDELTRNADLALYSAKSAGRGRVVSYSQTLGDVFAARVGLEYDLRQAIRNDELSLHYQPVVDPRSGEVICCEALLRWTHPVRGNIPPAEFISVAESTGLIVQIGAWALQQACSEAVTWKSDIKVAVNLSPIQFTRERQILDTVREVLLRTGLPPQRLELEVTESVLIEDTETTLGIIEALRAEHIGVSLDDFGAGFSSLGYLNDFPFTKVKIDRKLCQQISDSVRSQNIIKCIRQLTTDLGMELVAEGIESLEQLRIIDALGVTAVQGFVFSRPLSAQNIRMFVVGLASRCVAAPEPEAEPRRLSAA